MAPTLKIVGFVAMPFSPSDLPWWGWLLWGLLMGTVAAACWVFFSFHYDHKSTAMRALAWLALAASIPVGLIGGLTGLMGIVLFVKWVWTSA
jgi:hypothetical protein